MRLRRPGSQEKQRFNGSFGFTVDCIPVKAVIPQADVCKPLGGAALGLGARAHTCTRAGTHTHTRSRLQCGPEAPQLSVMGSPRCERRGRGRGHVHSWPAGSSLRASLVRRLQLRGQVHARTSSEQAGTQRSPHVRVSFRVCTFVLRV